MLVYLLSAYVSNPADAQPVASTETDGAGHYSIEDFAEGDDLIVVVGDAPRLTGIFLDVDGEDAGDVSSATTLAAEEWGARLAAGGTVTQGEIDGTVAAAEDVLRARTADELSAILDALLPASYGGGFPDDLPLSLHQVVNAISGVTLAACEALAVVDASGQPTGILPLTGVPMSFGDEPTGWVYDSEEGDSPSALRHLTYIERTEGEQAELLIPLHPANWMEGGPAQLAVVSEDGTMACPGLTFTVEPLEPAPGTLERMVDDFEGALEAWGGAFGYTRAELLATPAEALEPWAVPVAGGLKAIDGPDQENTLRAMLSGTAPILDGESIDEEALALFDALLALSEGTLPAGVPPGGSTLVRAPLSIPEPCIALPSDIETAEDLDCWMAAHATLVEEGQFRQDFYEGFSRSAAITLPVEKIMFLGMNGPTATVNSLVQFMHMMDQGLLHLMPSELLELDLEVDRMPLEEDAAATWSWSATLGARSSGWELDPVLALGVLPVGLGTGGSAIAKFLRQGQEMQQAVSAVVDHTAGLVGETEVLNIDFPPREWSVPVETTTDGAFFAWTLDTESTESGDDPFVFGSYENRYVPTGPGSSELTVRTRSGAFQGQNREDRANLEMLPIEVDFPGGNPIYMTPGESIFIGVDVENAIDASIDWSLVNGGGGITITPGSGDRHAAAIEANEPGQYQVRAESATRNGLRADNDPPRFDVAFIRVGELEVFPSPTSCILVGDAHQFSARFGEESVSFDELEWTISGPGSVSETGIFQASSSGAVTIVFSLRSDSDQTVTISFEVTEICGSFTLESSQFAFSGTCVTFHDDGVEGAGGVAFGSRFADDQHGGISFFLDFGEFMETSGDTWTMSDVDWTWGSNIYPNLSPTMPLPWGFHTDEEPGIGTGSLTLTRETKNGEPVLSGSFYGNFRWYEETADGIEERESIVHGEFRDARHYRDNTCWLG